MRTLEDYTSIVEVTLFEKDLIIFAEVIVTYNRHRYKFTSYNWHACNRIAKRDYVLPKVKIFGYSLKAAYEAFYKEFTKLRKVHSDKLTAIIR